MLFRNTFISSALEEEKQLAQDIRSGFGVKSHQFEFGGRYLHALAGLILSPTPPLPELCGEASPNRAYSHHQVVHQENGHERTLSTARSWTDLAFEGLVKSSLDVANETHLMLLSIQRTFHNHMLIHLWSAHILSPAFTFTLGNQTRLTESVPAGAQIQRSCWCVRLLFRT